MKKTVLEDVRDDQAQHKKHPEKPLPAGMIKDIDEVNKARIEGEDITLASLVRVLLRRYPKVGLSLAHLRRRVLIHVGRSQW